MAPSRSPNTAASRARTDAPGAGVEGGPCTLAIDVGGSHIKGTVLGPEGTPLAERVRIPTPVGSPPKAIVDAIADMVGGLPAFDRVSVGFPGAVRAGIVLSAPNLDHDGWRGFDLAAAMTARLGKPTRVLNDADMQGLGAIRERGLEMVATLGTGFGTGLYLDGRLLPHLEIAHMRFRKGETFDEQLGDEARRRVGRKKWNRRVRKAVAALRMLANFDHLYLGGGNAKHIAFELDPDVTIIDNEAALEGGVHAWRD